MRVESVGNGSYIVRHWRLPSVKQPRAAADVDALPDDSALLNMLPMEAVYRSRRMTNYALGHLEPGRHYAGNGTGLFVHVSRKGRVSFGQRLRVAGSGRRVEMGLGSWPAVRLERRRQMRQNIIGWPGTA